MQSFTKRLEAIMAGSIRKGLGLVLGMSFAASAGCDAILGGELNPAFCRAHLGDLECRRTYPDAEPDGPKTCTADNQCMSPMGVCDLGGTMTCVQCTMNEHDACSGMMPACVDNQCQKCTEHAQCAASSNVCLPDGSCADPAQVAYIDSTGTDNPACSKATQCTKVAKALATNRPYIKFRGLTDEAVSINDQNVTLLADPGAKLTRTSNGLLLEVKGTSQVAIYDLEVTGASGGTGIGISLPLGNTAALELRRVKVTNNAGGGITTSGGTLTVSQSIVRENAGGGISVGALGKFDIVGNVFFGNGSGTSTAGGVSILTSQAATNRLEFNSFNKNQAQDGVGSAVDCKAGVFTARNNIMSGNGTLTNMEQVGGTCTHTYSIVRPGMLPLGTGNMPGDPLFKNTTTGDLHLQSGSPAAGIADLGSDLTGIAAHDIDGNSRTSPADIGADEIP